MVFRKLIHIANYILLLYILLSSFYVYSQPVADFITLPSFVCSGISVNLTNISTGATSYQWMIDGVPYATSKDTSVTLYSVCSKKFKIILIASDGVIYDTTSKSLRVWKGWDSCGVSWQVGFTGCIGDTFVFIKSPDAISVSWGVSPPSALIYGCLSCDTIQVVVVPGGTYIGKVLTFFGGCQKTYYFNIEYVSVKPQVEAGPDKTTCLGEPVSIGTDITYATSTVWSPGYALVDSFSKITMASPTTTTTYVLKASNFGCGPFYDTVTVFVDTCVVYDNPFVVFVPNTFSPNADALNDILYVRGSGFSNLSLTIYSRWGQKMFESDNINSGWNGMHKGKHVGEGAYIYYIELTQNSGELFTQKGSITLIR